MLLGQTDITGPRLEDRHQISWA